MSRLPLDLYGEVTTASGARYRWDANQPVASRPQNLRFSTKLGEGFSGASLQLSRRIDDDYPDLNLVDDVTFTGADGSVAYEGRNSAMPRDLGDRHSIGVTLAGWMAHAKGRRFVMPFVDRDPGRWTSMPRERRARYLSLGVAIGDFSYGREQGGMTLGLPNQALGTSTGTEVWYQAPPGSLLNGVYYQGETTTFPAGWLQTFFTTDVRDGSSTTPYSATLDDTLRPATFTNSARYVAHQVFSNGTGATPAAGSGVDFSKIAAYGNHGLTLHTGDPAEPPGVYASDVIRWICDQFCPKLDPSGIRATDYVIQHLAFNDPTFPYDAFLEVNKYHLWHLGVWEGRRLDFRPYDLSDYDWEIRTDDPGTTFSPQGPDVDSLFNGTALTYTDPLTGVTERVTPDDYDDLADSSLTNPWNMHGEQHWDEIVLSSPSLLEPALNLGRAALADRNRPRTPGTITVRGYIRDRAGNEQPVWKVRAGDTIAITNFPNDAPRLIVETDYEDEKKSIRLAIDRPFALLDAYLDRVGNALGARGLV